MSLGATGYVVVVFGGDSPDCDLSHCPMWAYGPFATSEEAARFYDTVPDWQQPHVLLLKPSPSS